MNWYKKSQNNTSAMDIANKWKSQGITVYVYEDDNIITLDSLIVPKELRKQGIGSQVMAELINYADMVGKRVELSTGQKDKMHGTTSRRRLIDFYKKFDFLENKGRNKDFTTRKTMYREPRR